MSYNAYSVLYNLLKNKYNVPMEATYYEAIMTMKANGISEQELDALHEVWNEEIYEKGM